MDLDNGSCCDTRLKYCIILFFKGVRLNKPYSVRIPMDIPVFTGTHADLLIIVSVMYKILLYLYVHIKAHIYHTLIVTTPNVNFNVDACVFRSFIKL